MSIFILKTFDKQKVAFITVNKESYWTVTPKDDEHGEIIE